MKPQFRSILIGGVLALGLAGCGHMGMTRGGSGGSGTTSSGTGTDTSWGGLAGPDNGLARMNSDASGWGITPPPSGAAVFGTRRTTGTADETTR
jgi:hypothetical protein